MELYQLRSFITVSRTRSLRKAAETLHISQSALSTQIRTLEETLGAKLFERTPRGMRITDQGEVLLAHARETVDAAEKLMQAARSLGGSMPSFLRIGLNTDPHFLRMGRVNQALARSLPGTSVSFIASQTFLTEEMLRQGEMDMGFVYGGTMGDAVALQELAMVEIAVVIPRRILGGRSVSDLEWKEVAAMPWIWSSCNCPFHVTMSREMARFGVAPNTAADAVDESIVRELVMDGQGIGMMRMDEAAPLAEQGLLAVWDKGRIRVPLNIVWLKKRNREELIVAAAGAIRSVFASEACK